MFKVNPVSSALTGDALAAALWEVCPPEWLPTTTHFEWSLTVGREQHSMARRLAQAINPQIEVHVDGQLGSFAWVLERHDMSMGVLLAHHTLFNWGC